jgi:glucosamine--fructose-6-phosphate aminotransferase (isomerizing)
MCGIFGVIASPHSSFSGVDLSAGVKKAFHESERRGKDSSGVMCVSSRKILVTKSPARGKELIKSKSFRQLLSFALDEYVDGDNFVVLGHTRMATHGSIELDDNNQPILSNRSIVLHNGIVVNCEEIFQDKPGLTREFDVDTEVIPLLIEDYRRAGCSETASVMKTIKLISGANTFLYFNADSNMVYLNSSNGSLYVLEDKTRELFVFASEKQTLDKILDEIKYSTRNRKIFQPPKDRVLEINLKSYVPRKFLGHPLENVNERNSGREVFRLVMPDSSKDKKSLEITNNTGRHFPIGFQSNLPDFSELVRCGKCILPVNYPLLKFDESGVCELCQKESAFPQYGVDKLIKDLDIREGNRYLIPISGGRDSCYALHYAVRELNLKAVAYTYDWGFVTDVARKNISRMCGELGVEHILVAADLKMKRNNVRKNVSAWLKKPNLGMIPLFMAGDKDFFRFASEVKKEMGLSNSLFGMTRFEPAGFKTGFAGIRETSQYDKTFDLRILNKAKLVSFYAKQSVLNSGYLNSSLIDSLSGYYSYYMRKIDYLQLFDYIYWSEEEIVSKIKENYGWEGSSRSRNSWRIGDASAPFYNYLYAYFAGFTENDVYLSNLIRENHISRDEAMNLVVEYNLPDEKGFSNYCNLIGLDAHMVLSQIHHSKGFMEKIAP